MDEYGKRMLVLYGVKLKSLPDGQIGLFTKGSTKPRKVCFCNAVLVLKALDELASELSLSHMDSSR